MLLPLTGTVEVVDEVPVKDELAEDGITQTRNSSAIHIKVQKVYVSLVWAIGAGRYGCKWKRRLIGETSPTCLPFHFPGYLNEVLIARALEDSRSTTIV